jgi:hypothetical protein
MGMPIQFTKVLVTPTGTSIAAVQAHAASGPLTLSASPIFASQRRVLITLTASNSGGVIVASGTNESGTPIVETINISSIGTSFTSAMDFKSVTSITATTLTGNISAGGNGTGSSPWQMANPWNAPSNIMVSIGMTSSGAATCTVEGTIDIDPCGIQSNAPLTAVTAFSASLLTGLTTSGVGLITAGTSGVPTPVSAWRLTTTAGTGTVVVQAMDAGGGLG